MILIFTLILISTFIFIRIRSSKRCTLYIRIPACVHCISYRRLGSSYPFFHPVHVPDFCDCSTEESIIESTKQSMALWGDQVVLDTVTDQSEIIAVKEWVLNRITKALCGDCLAAEYVLLSMLSRTYSRDETGGNLLLGSLPINLNGLAVGDKRINDLKDVLTALVPSCVKVINYSFSIFLFNSIFQ